MGIKNKRWKSQNKEEKFLLKLGSINTWLKPFFLPKTCCLKACQKTCPNNQNNVVYISQKDKLAVYSRWGKSRPKRLRAVERCMRPFDRSRSNSETFVSGRSKGKEYLSTALQAGRKAILTFRPLCRATNHKPENQTLC